MTNSDTKLTTVAEVDVQSAWLSKINWGELVKVLAALAATRGINVPLEVQNDILMLIIALGGVYTWVMKTWFTKTITPASAASPAVTTSVVVKVLLVAFLVSLFLVPGAQAADVAKPSSSLVGDGYPTTRCGLYYGVNTMGSTGAVENAAIGTQTVQGSIGLIVGYTCPIGTRAFWFVDGMFNFANLNGSDNGMALSGPAVFEQRFGFGAPFIEMLPTSLAGFNLGGLAVPALMPLPPGVTAGPTNPYLFMSLHQTDVSAQLGLVRNKEWLISYGFGIGAKTRFSNGVVGDVFAEYDMRSNGMAFGPLGKTGLGPVMRVGAALEF